MGSDFPTSGTATLRGSSCPSLAWRLLLLIAFSGSSGCGGDPAALPPDPPATQPPAPTGPVTTTIQPSGGSATAVTDDGVRVTLSFPGGAVREATEITIRPLARPADLWMQVALEPVGQLFREPVTVTVTLAQPLQQDGMLLLRPASPIPMPTTADGTARTLSTNAMRFFGFPPEDSESAAALQVGGSIAAASASNTLGARSMSCQESSANGQAAFDAAVASGKMKDAVAAALAVAATLARQDCAESLDWTMQAGVAACLGLTNLLVEIDQTPIVEYGQYEEEIGGALVWLTLVQQLPGDCDADWMGMLEFKSHDVVRFAGERAARVVVPDFAAFIELRDDARSLLSVMMTAVQAGLGNVHPIIERLALFPVLNQARATAYNLCSTGVWHFPLSRLTPVGFFAGRDIIGVGEPRPGPVWPPPSEFAEFSESDIHDDLQYCGTDLSLRSFVASGGSLTSKEAGTLGVPGQFVNELSLEVPTRGSLQLDGDLLAISCWNDVPADHQIIVELDGRPVRTLTRSDNRYIGGTPIDLDIAEVTAEAGIVPREGLPSTLGLVRLRDQCEPTLYGPARFDLLEVALVWKNPVLEVDVQLPDADTPEGDVQAEVRVKVIDQLGQAGFFDAIDVVLDVEGGTALERAGQTDSEGYFRTTIQRSQGVGSGGSAGSLTVHATATSFEEVTATGSATMVPQLACTPLQNGFTGWVEETFQEGYGPRSGLTYEIIRNEFNDIASSAAAAPNTSRELRMTHTAMDSIFIIPEDPTKAGKHGFMRVRVTGRLEQTTAGGTWTRAEARVGTPQGDHFWIIGTNQNGVPLLEIDEIIHMNMGFGIGEWGRFHSMTVQWVATGGNATSWTGAELSVQIIDLVEWDPTDGLGNTIHIREICSASGTQYLQEP